MGRLNPKIRCRPGNQCGVVAPRELVAMLERKRPVYLKVALHVALAAMLVGCELAARANQSSMLSEWEGACSDGRHATAPSLRSVPMAPSVT